LTAAAAATAAAVAARTGSARAAVHADPQVVSADAAT
jgi:hypothetical protein